MRIHGIFVLLLLFSACSDFGRIQRKGTFEEKYSAAEKYFQEKNYYRAGYLFEDIIAYSAGRPEAKEIHLMNAYCNYYEGSLVYASDGFRRFYEKYPRSEKVEDAMFMYAKTLYALSPEIELDQTNTFKAMNALQRFLNQYPDTENKKECSEKIESLIKKLENKAYRIAKLNYKIEHYRAAVLSFTDFVLDYPSSEYNEELNFLKLKAQRFFAKRSVERLVKNGKTHYLKKDRLNDGKTFYYDFVRKYPNSGYLQEAEQLFKQIETELENIQNK